MTYRLQLYVTGESARSINAITNLRRICQSYLEAACEIEIIDVLECPARADQAKILATPTLIKLWPRPERRIIGDLSDRDQVLLGLAGGSLFTD